MHAHAKWAAGDPTSWFWRFKVSHLQALMDQCTRGLQASNYRMTRIHHGIYALSSSGIGTLVLIRWLGPLRPCAAQRIWMPPWPHYWSKLAWFRYAVLILSASVWCIELVFSVCVRSTDLILPVSVRCFFLSLLKVFGSYIGLYQSVLGFFLWFTPSTMSSVFGSSV